MRQAYRNLENGLNSISKHRFYGRSERLRVFLAVCVLFLSLGMLHDVDIVQASTRNVYIVPVSGMVDPGMAAFIKRTIEAHANDPDPLFILELDTNGGRVDSALQIVDTLLSVPEGKTVAFVKTKAISAGSLIALACSKLVMKKNTTIGDCAPITYSKEGPKELGEKFQSPLRAKFRTLARRNDYPETLAESMVTAEMIVYAVTIDGKTDYIEAHAFDELSEAEKAQISSKKTIVGKGELLTMDDTEAFELGFSKMSVGTIREMLKQMGVEDYTLIRIEESWSETLVRLVGSISPYLLMIGLAALYMEIKAPGFGVPGILGITCLALVFLNQYLVGLADYSELLLLVLGVLLFGFEIFVIPGFGIAGVAGLLLITVSAILAFQDFVIPDPSFPWQADLLVQNLLHMLGAFFVSILVALFALRYILPKLPVVVEGPYLKTTLKDFHADSIEAKGAETGASGIAMTRLRPSGKVKIDGEIFDAIADGEFMEKGDLVIVSEIKGNRIIVSRKPGEPAKGNP
jgi:membrane-bound serine protease (ClpP class)